MTTSWSCVVLITSASLVRPLCSGEPAALEGPQVERGRVYRCDAATCRHVVHADHHPSGPAVHGCCGSDGHAGVGSGREHDLKVSGPAAGWTPLLTCQVVCMSVPFCWLLWCGDQPCSRCCVHQPHIKHNTETMKQAEFLSRVA